MFISQHKCSSYIKHYTYKKWSDIIENTKCAYLHNYKTFVLSLITNTYFNNR